MTRQAKKTVTPQLSAIPGIAPLGLPEPKAKPTKQRKAKKQPKAKKAKAAPKEAPAATGSVVAKAWKAKASKDGIWKNDAMRDAVKSAFLREGGTDVSPAEAARIATDNILTENHLDAGRWAGKNPGMLAMNLGNVLRALLRNDGVAYVYGKKIGA